MWNRAAQGKHRRHVQQVPKSDGTRKVLLERMPDQAAEIEHWNHLREMLGPRETARGYCQEENEVRQRNMRATPPQR
jgi:hypothetical protein